MAAAKASSDSKPTELKDLISDEEFKSKQLVIDSDLSDVCKAAIGAYALLVSIVFGFAENYEHATEHLRPPEKTVAAAAAGACAAAGLASLCRLQLQKSPIGSKSVHLCVTLVHLIAACTNFVLWYLPMPVVHNRFTGNPVYIMRWCEWTVLSFVMQFLIESVGSVPEKYSFRSCFLWAACMCGSTACGLFFPFMPNFFSFAVLLFISCWLYFLIFPRLFALGQEARESTDSRLRVAYQLQLTCAFTWTLFVLVWFGNWIWAAFNPGRCPLSPQIPASQPLSDLIVCSEASSWPFYLEASIDVCAKVLYASAIEGLDQEKHETQRESQSKKVSELMTTIWTLCGDVFVLSNQPSGCFPDCCTHAAHSCLIVTLLPVLTAALCSLLILTVICSVLRCLPLTLRSSQVSTATHPNAPIGCLTRQMQSCRLRSRPCSGATMGLNLMKKAAAATLSARAGCWLWRAVYGTQLMKSAYSLCTPRPSHTSLCHTETLSRFTPQW